MVQNKNNKKFIILIILLLTATIVNCSKLNYYKNKEIENDKKNCENDENNEYEIIYNYITVTENTEISCTNTLTLKTTDTIIIPTTKTEKDTITKMFTKTNTLKTTNIITIPVTITDTITTPTTIITTETDSETITSTIKEFITNTIITTVTLTQPICIASGGLCDLANPGECCSQTCTNFNPPNLPICA
jgi:hypothetical protein